MVFKFNISEMESEAGDDHRNFRNELIKRFIDKKKETGITQKSISETMQVNKSQVSRLFKGIGNPTLTTLSNISFALGCKLKITLEPISHGGNSIKIRDKIQNNTKQVKDHHYYQSTNVNSSTKSVSNYD